MSGRSERDGLGGRTKLLDPATLSRAQRSLYDHMDESSVPWAEKAGFEAKLPDGRFIGPFNLLLLTPDIGRAFLDLQAAEEKHTRLSARERQVVILSVGAAYESAYERYAHRAVASQAGFSPETVRALSEGRNSDELTDREAVAQRFTLELSRKHRVGSDLFEETRAAFADGGIADMILLCGCYYAVASMLNAFDVPSPSTAAAGTTDRAG